MKFSQPAKEKTKNCEIVIRRSECENFTIITPKLSDKRKLWHLTEDQRCVLREGMSTIGAFRTVREAIAEADKQAADKAKVWHYFVERAEREIELSKTNLADPNWKSRACTISVQGAKKALNKTVEELAQEKYNYAKYRAFLKTGPESMAWSKRIDPAAWRDWNAMLDGTYVQWWDKVAI